MIQLQLKQPLHGYETNTIVWAIRTNKNVYVLVEDYHRKNQRIIKPQHLL